MINEIIYWTGVCALVSIGLLVIVIAIWVSARMLRNEIVKDLKSAYHHVQLVYFMKEIKKRGYKLALEDYDVRVNNKL